MSTSLFTGAGVVVVNFGVERSLMRVLNDLLRFCMSLSTSSFVFFFVSLFFLGFF